MKFARERVRAWVAAGRRALRPYDDALVDALAQESGLSPQGVRWALDRIVEVDVDERDVERMSEGVRFRNERREIAVVLAANVFTAPFRAIAWALAQSRRVVVRPSRRSSAFVAAIAKHMNDHVEVRVAEGSPADDLRAIFAALPDDGALHLYGGATAIAEARALSRTRPSVGTELHGPGVGVVLAPSDVIMDNAKEIALDVVAFDQRGCLSPRLVVAVGTSKDAAEALHAALTEIGATIPRGTTSEEEKIAANVAIEAAKFAGTVLQGPHHAVLDLGGAEGAPIGPVGRILPVVAARDFDDALHRLAPIAQEIARVAIADVWRRSPRLQTMLTGCGGFARLGEMQRPPFDGPVDHRALFI
jgi:hypothetical protein